MEFERKFEVSKRKGVMDKETIIYGIVNLIQENDMDM